MGEGATGLLIASASAEWARLELFGVLLKLYHQATPRPPGETRDEVIGISSASPDVSSSAASAEATL
jgi:hypothetical protein